MCELSVIIPTYRRPAKLSACLERLARQTLRHDRYEVLVGLDGEDPDSERAAQDAWKRAEGRGMLRVIRCPKQGLNATRNRVLAEARGTLLASMNDDVLAEPRFLEAHAKAHAEAAGRFPAGVIITGYSPFVTPRDATLFDHLCGRTSMLFFYDTMMDPDTGALRDADPWRDWGFRHCWGLNFSAPLEPIRSSGGFLSFENQYGYDDIEVAHRLRSMCGAPVLFRPEARAEHDHRYTPREVLLREFRLGVSAWHFAGVAPDFARAVFGRDIRAAESVSAMGTAEAQRPGDLPEVERDMIASGRQHVGDMPAAEIRDRAAALYARFRELKRSIWRRGVLHAMGAGPAYEVGEV